MDPQNVPEELVELAAVAHWTTAPGGPAAAVGAYGDEMRKILAAVLPAHEAIVRAKVAGEARTVIRSQAATGVPLGALASLSYFAAKLDESVGDPRGGQ